MPYRRYRRTDLRRYWAHATAAASDDTYGGNVWAQAALDVLASRSLS